VRVLSVYAYPISIISIDRLGRFGPFDKIKAEDDQNDKDNHRKSGGITQPKIGKSRFVDPRNENVGSVRGFPSVADEPDNIEIVECPDDPECNRRNENRFEQRDGYMG
jgi:hypothetical protein